VGVRRKRNNSDKRHCGYLDRGEHPAAPFLQLRHLQASKSPDAFARPEARPMSNEIAH
jgi:hypothetical protein